ncbi:alpha/beta hydrolase family protein [Novosphingobium aquiterrae]|uniref:Alpha/beta hydrolase family protein n=2 Tax=Novosphingobium aquiterrae TaxID=624388 RepID=A0ABV6PHL7_9SPHN
MLSAPALAQTAAAPFDAAKAFGSREGVLDIAISPDGKKLAVVIPRPVGGEAVTVLDLEGVAKPQLALTSKGVTEQIQSCHWAGNTRLLCSLWFVDGKGKDTYGFTRSVALNPDGSNAKVIGLTKAMNAVYRSSYGGDLIDLNGGGEGVVLMARQFVPNLGTGTILKADKEGLGVVRIDTNSGKETIVEQPKLTVSSFIADGQGKVRIIGLQTPDSNGYAGNKVFYRYRPAEGGDWRDLSTVTYDPAGTYSGFDPVAVDPAANVAYGFDERNGFKALYKVPLDGSGAAPSIVLSKAGIDVDGLLRIGRNQRIVGATYATLHRVAEYSDPELARLSQSLRRALGNKTQLGVIDASADESKLVLFAGGDTDPGKYYLFDKTSKKLSELLAQRPLLNGAKLGAMQAITFPAADGTAIPAYLTLPPGSDGKNLPLVVMPHGGPEARDEWGFDWLSQFFASRGYAVIQPQYRGSTGFGSAFFGRNGFQAWRKAIGDIDDAARWAIKQGVASADKVAIVGWSYGGYAALQSQVVDPTLYKAVVAIAPVTDLDVLRNEWINTTAYKLESARIGTGPHVEEGSPARHADVFRAPVLLFHGDRDQNVGVGESRLMASKLKAAGKSVDYVEFPGLDHQLDDSAARSRMLSQSDAFLRKALGLPPG